MPRSSSPVCTINLFIIQTVARSVPLSSSPRGHYLRHGSRFVRAHVSTHGMYSIMPEQSAVAAVSRLHEYSKSAGVQPWGRGEEGGGGGGRKVSQCPGKRQEEKEEGGLREIGGG